MQKFIITSCLTGSAIIILITSGFFNSLLLFLLVGQIPGSSTTLSADMMQALIALSCIVFVLLALRSSRQQFSRVLAHLEKSFAALSTVLVKRQNRFRP